MRLKHALFILLTSGLIGLTNGVALEHKVSVHAVHISRRQKGLGNVLGGWNDGGSTQGQSQGEDQGQDAKDSGQDNSPTKTSDSDNKASIFDFFSTALPMETGAKKDGSATTTAFPSHSIIGTPPPLPTPTPKSSTDKSGASSTSSSSPSSTAAVLASSNGDSGNSQWKIIGVAVIAFSAVAAILLLAVFFDQWWRFVKDLIGRHKAKDQVEEIVPDWEKASWEVRFGDDRHRYPSFSSIPDKSSTQGLVRGRSIRSEGQWKDRAAEAVQRSPVSSSSGHPPSPTSVNRIQRSPTKVHAMQYHETQYPNPFEPPPRSPAPPDVYGGME